MIRNDSMTLCDIEGMQCYFDNQNINPEDYPHLFPSHGVCKCLEACNSIEYKTELVIYSFAENYTDETDETNRKTSIEFRYKESEYFPYVRYQQFKTEDFVAYVGGLLGLFAG